MTCDSNRTGISDKTQPIQLTANHSTRGVSTYALLRNYQLIRQPVPLPNARVAGLRQRYRVLRYERLLRSRIHHGQTTAHQRTQAEQAEFK
jgi:hypothetical protein